MLTSGGAGPETESGPSTQGSIKLQAGPLDRDQQSVFMYTESEVRIIRQIYKRTPSIPWRHLLLPCLLPVPVNLIEKRSPNQPSREPAQDNARELLSNHQRLERRWNSAEGLEALHCET
jgi:hypothetical protein